MYSIHSVYFKRCNTFHLLEKLEINFRGKNFLKKLNGKHISLKVTVTYIVHPRKEEGQIWFHFHEFHQKLNLLRGGEKRQLSKRSMFTARGICYTPS